MDGGNQPARGLLVVKAWLAHTRASRCVGQMGVENPERDFDTPARQTTEMMARLNGVVICVYLYTLSHGARNGVFETLAVNFGVIGCC